MYKLRLMIQRMRPNINWKAQWTKDEAEMEALLYDHLAIRQSTFQQIKMILDKDHISYREGGTATKSFSSHLDGTDRTLSFTLSGPILWRNYIPSGSKYDIKISFLNSEVSSVKVSLMELHL